MSTTKALTGEARERVGKGAARALRIQGLIPAVIYGDKKPPLSLTLNQKDLTKLVHAGGFMTTIFEIQVGKTKERVIPRDFQRDPVKETLLHIDFLRVSKDAVITVDVPVHFLNQETSPAIKRGGMLNIVRHTVELAVPADNIPDFIEVDLATANIGDSIHISAVKLPKGAKPVIHDRDFTIATLVAPSAGVTEDEAPAAEDTKAS